ncbi:hypothetical protein ACT4MK_02995 [Bradyrhizobium barranii]|uniref:hypothetical protein n=1 Tax=Bradyrhizobium TaxID=374 RepID=UPI003F257C83
MDVGWSDAVLVIPPKKAISIASMRTCSSSSGVRAKAISAVNAVLRSYMQQKTKPKKRA